MKKETRSKVVEFISNLEITYIFQIFLENNLPKKVHHKSLAWSLMRLCK